MWVCRPKGWRELEIYLPGDETAPEKIEDALNVLRHALEIDRKGRSLAGEDLELNWIDLTKDPPVVAFPGNEDIYDLWEGVLDEKYEIRGFRRGTW